MRKVILKAIAIIAILTILISPYLLIIDFSRYSPFLLSVWLLSAAYYVFVISRKDSDEEKKHVDKDENGEDELNLKG